MPRLRLNAGESQADGDNATRATGPSKADPWSLQPLLHYHPAPLELRQIPKHYVLVAEVLAWESRHQHIRWLARNSAVNEVVDIRNRMRSVEAGTQSCTIQKSDLETDGWLRAVYIHCRWSRRTGCR